MVLGSEDAASDPRREHRLERTALTTGEELGVETERPLEVVQLLQHGPVATVGGHEERAAPPVPDGRAGVELELVDERGIALGGGQVEAKEGLLAVVDLGDGGKHARGRPGRPRAWMRVGHRHPQPGHRRSPGRGQADTPAADDDHVEVVAARTAQVRTAQVRAVPVRARLIWGIHAVVPHAAVGPGPAGGAVRIFAPVLGPGARGRPPALPAPVLPGSGPTVGSCQLTLSAWSHQAPVCDPR